MDIFTSFGGGSCISYSVVLLSISSPCPFSTLNMDLRNLQCGREPTKEIFLSPTSTWFTDARKLPRMSTSWLSYVASLPIFELPSMATTTTTTGELPRPASPRLASTLFPSSSSSRYANAGINQVEERREGKGGRRNKLVIARGVDLIVSVGKEIRITNLTEYKGRLQDVESDLEKGKVLGPYKVRLAFLLPISN